MWQIVEKRHAEAVYCISFIEKLAVEFSYTQYNTIVTVDDATAQIGLNERVTGELWLQCPRLACLLGTGITFDAGHIWLDDVLIFVHDDDTNVLMCGNQLIDCDNTDTIVWNISQLWKRLNTTFRILFKLMLAQDPVIGINQPIVEHCQRILSMIDSKEPMTLDVRQAVSNSITALAQYYSYRPNNHGVVELLKDLHQMSIDADHIQYGGITIPKTLFAALLCAECRDTYMGGQ